MRHWHRLPRDTVNAPSRPVWMVFWAAWSGGGQPCLWQGVGTRWSLRSLPTQAILWFYNSLILSFSDSTILSFYGITNLSSEKSYVVECSSGIWKKMSMLFWKKKYFRTELYRSQIKMRNYLKAQMLVKTKKFHTSLF